MLLEAIYHRPKLNWAYAYDRHTIHIRLRTKRNDVEQVTAIAGDKYAWEDTVSEFGMDKWMSDELFDYWQTAIRPPFRRLRYGFKLQDGNEILYYTETGFSREAPEHPLDCFDFPYIHPGDIFTPPAWVRDAVFYQIFPDRFANGNPHNDPNNAESWGGKPTPSNFFGGDLQGVIDHLDYLTELGVNALYFTPIFEATTNHKYDTADYMKIDPHFGTNETLKELVQLCHNRGIRILLDAVFNHSGETFPPFLDVLKNGKRSRYRDWFHVREWPLTVKKGIPTYDTFAFEPLMPKLNTENPEVKEYLLQVAKYWVEEIGIDGWRLDVANEVNHRFWREFRDTVKKANPDAYLLGEIWHDSLMWLQGDQFDAVMNYPFANAVHGLITKRKLDGAGFAHAVSRLLAGYPQQVNESAFNLLDSHDTPRLLTECEGNIDRMKAAALLQFTFPGTPCIYYGDEIGLDGGADPDCRACMEWNPDKQNRDLFGFYQKLIAIRLHSPALRSGSLRFLHAEPSDRLLVFERIHDQELMLVLLNAEENSRLFSLQTPISQWEDLFESGMVNAEQGTLNIQLPPFGFKLLRSIKKW